MKNLKIHAFCVLLLISTYCSAQNQNKIPITEPNYNKPRLFNALPARLPLNTGQVNAVINEKEGGSVDMNLADQLIIKGTVISISDKKSSDIKTVVIKSSNLPGCFLTLTAFNKGGETIYTGRILSREYGDAYEIQEQNGNYYLQKINLYDLLSE
jgi:hypothetical protein